MRKSNDINLLIMFPLYLLWSLLLICFISLSTYAQITESDPDIYFQSISGTVDGGNYSYYSVHHPGRLVVWLDSLEGDADLYASTRRPKPTLFLNEHEYSSTTCGIDTIDILASSRRPLHIGVYGHYTHPITTFKLRVYMWAHDTTDVHMVNYPDVKPYDISLLEGLALEASASPPKTSSSAKGTSIIHEVFHGALGDVIQFFLHILVEIFT